MKKEIKRPKQNQKSNLIKLYNVECVNPARCGSNGVC